MKRAVSLFVVVLLLLSSSASGFSSVSDYSSQNLVGANSKVMVASSEPPEPVVVTTIETIEIFSDGDCYLHILMETHNSSLSTILRYLFDFSSDLPQSANTSVPETVTFADELNRTEYIDGREVTYTPIDVAPAATPVRELFLNGIIEEHWYSLGINITYVWQGYPCTWGTGGACVVEIKAHGELTQLGSGTAIMGPKDVNASFDRVGFILNKIAYTQQMLGSFSSEHYYVNTWTVRFIGSVINQAELIGKRWFQDFGNGTSLESELMGGTSNELVLTETMKVTENLISVTPEELLEDSFLCYKVFHIQYGTGGGGLGASNTLSTSLEGGEISGFHASGFDPSWSMNLLDEEFTIPITEQVTMNLNSQVTFSGKVSWDFKWFRLHKFEAWTKLTATINVTLEVEITDTYESPPLGLIKRNRRKFFMVGSIPVLINLKFNVTAYLEVTATTGTVTFQAIADGSMRSGVGWKRGRGWYPIRDVDMDFDPQAPEYTPDVWVQIRPSVGFRLTLIFYESAGPFIEFKPYVLLTLYAPPSTYDWTFELGIDVNAGIDFEDWLERILRLDEFIVPVFNFVLWRCYDCEAPKEHDVTVMSVLAPDRAFVTEPVTICVDVSNIGNTVENDVDVYLENNASGVWDVIPDGYKTISSLAEGKSNTTVFEWNTSSLPQVAENYTLRARVEIPTDNDLTNNNFTDWVYLEVQNVHVIDVTARPSSVVQGQSVEINVTVENEGTVIVPSLPVFAYINQSITTPQPISLIWCESMNMVFNLLPEETRTLTYRWDTSDFSTGTYTISANTTLLPYEIDENDNTLFDGDVTIVGGTRIPDIAILNIGFSNQMPVKGETLDIQANVQNSGIHAETFDVVAYTDAYIIQRKVVQLPASTSTLITLTWNTTGREAKGNLTVTVKAVPLPDEIITINNYATDWVLVSGIGHDVTVKNPIPKKTIVGEGLTLPVDVKATNVGNFIETFDVTIYAIYANSIHFAPSQSITLEPFASINITFSLNTTGFTKGYYLISAYVWPVEGETDTSDNTSLDGWIIVAMPGDITGSPTGYPDGKVDMKDIGKVAKLFSVNYPDPKYDANCDIIYDLKIDMKDISFVAKRFGQVDP